MRLRSAKSTLKAYAVLAKPRQLALLMITMYGAYFAAGGGINSTLALLTLTGAASIAGATYLNMLIDRDIDFLMYRTRSRPLPSGKVSPQSVLVCAVALLAVGTLAAASINVYVLGAVLAGLVFDVVLYTVVTKRRTPLSIVPGSVAGGMPALGGWAAATGSPGIGGVLLALAVILWQPMHVWFLAYYYKRDYERAGIPVLPSLTVRGLAVASLAAVTGVVGVMWAYAAINGYGVVTALITSLAAATALPRIAAFASSGGRSEALSVFKAASMVIAVVFLSLPIERVLNSSLLLKP